MSNERPLASVIFPAKNEGINVLTSIESVLQVRTSIPFEIVVVDDHSDDGCCDFLDDFSTIVPINRVRTDGVGAAMARNIGADHARGDFFIFCDAHLYFENEWMEKLIEPLLAGKASATTPGIAPTNEPDTVGYGQTLNASFTIDWHYNQEVPFETAILPGGCFAISRDVFYDIGGFERGFRIWGHEDIEFSIKMWLFGYSCWVVPNVKVLHLFRETQPYHVAYEDVYYNMLRIAYSHFTEARIDLCRNLILHPAAEAIELEVLASDVLLQRQNYFRRRKFDDEWFFDKFSIPI